MANEKRIKTITFNSKRMTKLNRSLFRLLAGCLLYPLTYTDLPAQDLDKVQPAPVPKMVEVEEGSQATEPELNLEQLRTGTIGAHGNELELVSELKGIIFLRDPSDLGTVQLSPGQASNLGDYPDLDTEGMRGVVELYVGLPVSKESLQRLRYTFKFILSQEGKPFSLVYTPPQDITDGTIQFVIQASTVGSVRVEGAKYFSEASYLSRLKIKPDGELDARSIRTGMDRINQNAFRSAALQVEKGSEPATTDVVLQVRERRPYRYFVGYNNTGSQSTTMDRMFAGFTLGNVLGMAHQLTMQVTTDLEIEHSKSLSGNYSMDLPGNHTATLFGAYSEIVSVPNGGFNQEGESWQLGLNYNIPFESLERYTHSLELGFDYKSSDNNLELSLPPFIIPISNNLTHVIQGRVQYRGSLSDNWGGTSFGAKVTYSPGDLNEKNEDAAFRASRAGASSEYAYLTLNASRSVELKRLSDALDGWTWLLQTEFQFSNRNLLSSEQFSAGGSGSVRGYEESEIVGDNAFFLSQELQFPVIETKFSLVDFTKPGALQFFIFEDYAKTWNTDLLVGEEAFYLHSIGGGLRYQVGQNLSLNLTHGWQLRDSGNSSTGDNRRVHASLQISY